MELKIFFLINPGNDGYLQTSTHVLIAGTKGFFNVFYVFTFFGCGWSRSTSMQIFGLLAQKLSDLVAILFFTFWLRAVKIYFHAKFRASSFKIERIMRNFGLLALKLSALCSILFYGDRFVFGGHIFYSGNSCGRSRSTCMQNFMLLA